MEIPAGCPTREDIEEFIRKTHIKPFPSEIQPLGVGAFGEVVRYRGNWVIKMIKLRSSEMTKATFFREVEILREIAKHPELADYTAPFCWADTSSTGGTGFIVQKFVDTITLESLLNNTEVLSKLNSDAQMKRALLFNEGYPLFRNLIEAMNLLHKAGFLHRDLKPANILVRVGASHTPDMLGKPILIDFGLACKLPCNERGRVGTPTYSPSNWASSTEIVNPKASLKNQRTFRSRAWLRQRPRTLEEGIFGKLSPEVETTADILHSRKKNRPGPNWKAIKTQPTAFVPEYAEHVDKYAMFKTLEKLYDRLDWTGYEEEKEYAEKYLEDLRRPQIAALAAQAARNEPAFIKVRRLNALKRLNTRREGRMENRARENENAEVEPQKGTRKRGRANGNANPASRKNQKPNTSLRA